MNPELFYEYYLFTSARQAEHSRRNTEIRDMNFKKRKHHYLPVSLLCFLAILKNLPFFSLT